MAADRDAGVDPRFDPVFQRGYNPSKHGGHPPPPAPRHATAPTPVTPMLPVMPIQESEPVAVSPQADAEPRRSNPFHLAILLVSIVSAAGAAVLLWRRFDDEPYGGFLQTQSDLFFYQFIDSLMAPLLTGALVGFSLWLALWAIRPRAGRD